MTAPLLQIDRATVLAGGRAILEDADLEVRAGEVTALIGRNGSGKSTLIRLAAGIRRPDRGRALCGGEAIHRIPPRRFARLVAHLPQTLPPAPGMTVRELAAFGRYPHHGALGRRSAEDAAAIARALSGTGLDALADREVDALSGGERQRAWLAMALAQEASVLLLDEPTAALDVAHQVEVLTLVRSLARDRGLAVVMVLHDVDMAARFADRIVALDAGRIVASGGACDILQPEMLRRIYGLELGVMPHPVSGRPMSYLP
ncbi:ABC transporter ATP-binding protein (plasmid) [Tistrella mobilis]|uniref:ABC transporter ATP-binding protein n=1 Tax=Tistrella mobilis TaxID=171437 RepID=UPI0035578DD2